MEIELLAHRGLWGESCPANSMAAFHAALDNRFGIETDVRDACGEVVISHDPPCGHRNASLHDLVQLCAETSGHGTLALDIKADGLAASILDLTHEYEIENYFVFDMSIPDMVHYVQRGIPFFTRQSEYEPEPAFYAECAGVWLDDFVSDWFNVATIQHHLNRGKSVAVVSPELHGRPYESVWDTVCEVRSVSAARLFLCTDYPKKFLKDHAN